MENIFKEIRTIDDIAPFVSELDYIHRIEQNGFVTFSYAFSYPEAFQTKEEIECRGITFYPNGELASRALHKFFNINEREKTLEKNIDFSKLKAVYNKLDGSMIQSIVYEGEVLLKSKRSFTSDVAVKAKSFIDKEENSEYVRFCKDMSEMNLSPTFEYTSPDNLIVVGYKEEKLTLLQIRDNLTGEYLDIEELSKGYGIDLVEKLFDNTTDIKVIMDSLNGMENQEGYIFLLDDGTILKGKCEWYLDLHRSFVFLRERDIAKLVCGEKIDDFKAKLKTTGFEYIDFEKIELIENEIVEHVLYWEKEVNSHIDVINEKFLNDNVYDYKSINYYLKENVKDSNVVYFVFNIVRDRENDYMECYKKNVLKERWGLTSISDSVDL